MNSLDYKRRQKNILGYDYRTFKENTTRQSRRIH